MPEDSEEYGLIMKFLDQSPSFCYGFECGQLWHALTRCESVHDYLAHTDNKVQLELILKRFLYKYTITPAYEDPRFNDWILINAEIEAGRLN